MATRRLAEGERWIRERRPWAWHMFMLLGTGLQGKTLGVVGMGQIGGALARRAKAFGMTIVYSDERQAPPELEAELEAERLELDDLLAPLRRGQRPRAAHGLDAPPLQRRAAGQDALRRVPGQQRPRAARSTRARSPRRCRTASSPAPASTCSRTSRRSTRGLLELDNVVLLPHLGSATIETRTAMAELAARNALAVLAGERPETALNYDDVSR